MAGQGATSKNRPVASGTRYAGVQGAARGGGGWYGANCMILVSHFGACAAVTFDDAVRSAAASIRDDGTDTNWYVEFGY